MAVRIGVGLGLGGFPFASISGALRAWLDVCEDSSDRLDLAIDRVVSREPMPEPSRCWRSWPGRRVGSLGTNAIVAFFRDPITFARQCATLDQLSEGRLLPAIGVGREDAPEWAATGRSPRGRGTRADEALDRSRASALGAQVDFEGEHYSARDASISPRPVQQPLPLWLGGASPAAIRRTVRFGNGWLAPLQGPDEAGLVVKAIREEGHRQGRPIPDDHFGATILFHLGAAAGHESFPIAGVPRDPALARRLGEVQAVGDAGAVLDRIRAFRAQGVTKFVAIPMARDAAGMIEQCRLLDREVIPHAND
ncbi:MAG: LLM class flavin-dependent oxidoreductase [Myxococcota bacterium]